MINPNRFLNKKKLTPYFTILVFLGLFIFSILLLLFFGGNNSSDIINPIENNSDNSGSSRINMMHYLLKTIGITGIILILLIVGLNWYKYKIPSKKNNFSMKVLGKQYISSKQYLMMVKVDGQKMLLGVTDHSVGLIKEYKNNSRNINGQD